MINFENINSCELFGFSNKKKTIELSNEEKTKLHNDLNNVIQELKGKAEKFRQYLSKQTKFIHNVELNFDRLDEIENKLFDIYLSDDSSEDVGISIIKFKVEENDYLFKFLNNSNFDDVILKIFKFDQDTPKYFNFGNKKLKVTMDQHSDMFDDGNVICWLVVNKDD